MKNFLKKNIGLFWATLTYEQRRIKEGIEKGLVKFEIIRI